MLVAAERRSRCWTGPEVEKGRESGDAGGVEEAVGVGVGVVWGEVARRDTIDPLFVERMSR